MSASHSRFGRVGGEVPFDEVVVGRGAGLACLAVAACFLPNADHQPLAEQIRHAVRSAIAWPVVAGLVGQEPVAELGIVAVGVEQARSPGTPATHSASVTGCASHR